MDGSAPLAEGGLTLAFAMEAGGHWKEKRIRSTGEKTCEGLCCERRQPKACFSC